MSFAREKFNDGECFMWIGYGRVLRWASRDPCSGRYQAVSRKFELKTKNNRLSDFERSEYRRAAPRTVYIPRCAKPSTAMAGTSYIWQISVGLVTALTSSNFTRLPYNPTKPAGITEEITHQPQTQPQTAPA